MSLTKKLRRILHPAPARAPDFLIIGVAKGATTTLMANLNRHLDLFLPAKEIEFFSSDAEFAKGRAWYQAHFKTFKRLAGDKSPGTIYHLRAHRRMAAMLPRAKLILLLRDPVRRAISNWNMRVAKGRIRDFTAEGDPSFTALVDHYLRLRGSERARLQPFDIIHRGLYAEQIEHLLGFYPRDQLHIAITEHLAADPDSCISPIFAFLGVPTIPPHPGIRRRAGRYPAAAIEESARDRLRELYRPHNERLFELLGRRIAEWEEDR